MFTSSIAIAINIILSIILSKNLGIKGIAIATVISMNVGAILLSICYIITFKIKIQIGKIFASVKIISAFIATFICAYLVISIFVMENLLLDTILGTIIVFLIT